MNTTPRDQERTALIEVPSLVDAVHRAVQARILDGTLPPGSIVTELAVATEFSVARTTAKAAVERLVHDGLLRRAANKSARVPVIGEEDVRDVYFSRRLLEGAVIQGMAIEGGVPEDTQMALKRFGSVFEHGDWVQAAELENTFHRSLVDSLGSERLSRVFGSLMDETRLCQAQARDHASGLPSPPAQDYAAIVDAIQACNQAQAVSLIETNLDNTRNRLISQLRQHRSE